MKELNKLTMKVNKVNAKVRDVNALASGDPGKMVKRAKNKFMFRWIMRLFRGLMR